MISSEALILLSVGVIIISCVVLSYDYLLKFWLPLVLIQIQI